MSEEVLEAITSLGKLKEANLGGHFWFHLDSRSENRMDQDKAPHGHVLYGSSDKRVASVSLDAPFDIYDGEKNVPRPVKKKLVEFLQGNVGYIHFLWDWFSQRGTYVDEYDGPEHVAKRQEYNANLVEQFKVKLD